MHPFSWCLWGQIAASSGSFPDPTIDWAKMPIFCLKCGTYKEEQ